MLYRQSENVTEVLLGHPGGPYFARKDLGSWTIPKGLVEGSEVDLEAARREFEEETGLSSEGPYLDLGEVRYRGGKRLRAWAFRGDCEPATLESNAFEIEWPPRSGRRQSFPELDRFEFFAIDEAFERIHPVQSSLLEALMKALASCSAG